MLTRRAVLSGAMMAGAGAMLPAGKAVAQGDRTVRIVAGFPAGGGIDISARLLVDPFKDALGAPVIVENRTGAAGMIAANTVAKAAPDGRTLLMATSGEIAISHHLYKEKMTYDPLKELAPIALVGIVPCLVVVADATPVRTPQELIAYAKANAGKLSFSSSGIGNPQQLAGELMNMMAGTNVLHVPYRGAAPAVTDVATGAVTMSFTSLGRGARPDAGRKNPRGRRHLARADAAASRRRAVAGGRAGAEGLRAAQLVRAVLDRRHAGRHGGAAQRANGQGAGGAQDRGDARGAGHRRAQDHRRAVQGLSSKSESRKFAGIIEKAGIKLET